MAASPAELRTEFLRLRAAGLTPPPPRRAPEGNQTKYKPSKLPMFIDRNADSNAQIRQIAAGIAVLLGEPWSHVPDDDYRGETIRGEGEAAFHLYNDHAKRIEFSGVFPRSKTERNSYFSARDPRWCDEVQYKRITVARSRSVESIAGDVASRFLPGYLHEFAYQLEQRDRHDERVTRADALTRELAAIIAADPRGEHGRAEGLFSQFSRWWGPGHNGTRVAAKVPPSRPDDGRGVELEIETDPETARAILGILSKVSDE